MTTQPLATIVVTTRERYSIVTRTLETLYNNTPKEYPVIYIASGATAEINEYLTTACQKYHYELIITSEFLTPNMARNIGIAKANTKYIVFIENDVVVENNWLDSLIQCAEEEKADCVSPLCLIGEPEQLYIHSFGGKMLFESHNNKTRIRENHHLEPICLKTTPRKLTRLESDYSEFHCALIRRSVFEKIGLLDENIKGAAEHVDLALHLKALNCRGFAEPNAVVSYLPYAYTLNDYDTYKLRWSSDWYYPTMQHLAEKWQLAQDSVLFSDYYGSFLELRQRCLLKQVNVNDSLPPCENGLVVAQTFTQLILQMQELAYPLDAQTKIKNAYQIACELFAGSFRASGNTFISHLVGVSSIMVSCGAAPAVISAALLHAAYQQGRFPMHVINAPAMRRWLKRRVGSAVETLVYHYSWLKLADVSIYQTNNFNHCPIEFANVILIRIANAIEDRIHGNAHFTPKDWLQKSNANIQEWMAIYIAISKRLDMQNLVTLLQDILKKVAVSTNNMPCMQTSNYYIETTTGKMQSLNIKDMLADELASQTNIVDFNKYKLDIKAILACNDSESDVSHQTDHTKLVFHSKPWTYSAYLPTAHLALASNNQRVKIEMLVHTESGNLGIVFLERNSSVHMLTPEQSVNPSQEPVKVHVEIDSLDELGNIVFRSWPSESEKTIAKIYSVTVMAV